MEKRTESRWLSAADAAARLGVRTETVYAYVSRGLLPRYAAPGGRRSRFLAADVEHLAARGRRGAKEPPAPGLVVRSALTEISGGETVRFRGHDVAGLVEQATFEQVAELLWTGALPGDVTWRPSGRAVATARRVQEALPPEAGPLDRLRLSVEAAATADPLRQDLRPDAVRAAARTLLASLVESLPAHDDPGDDPGDDRFVEGCAHIRAEPSTQPEGRRGFAGQLWGRLAAGPAVPAGVALLDAALVLLADHELAASTLAVRVAASARCDPYAALACGLAVSSGPRHGAAGLAVEGLLAEIEHPEDVERAIARQLRGGERLAGFGHTLYRERDPRAVLLLSRLRRTFSGNLRIDVVERVLAVAAERGLPAPNIDLALAAFVHLARMAPGSSSVIFALARCAGWIAHALEQYAEEGLIRPRAVYTGP
jgi:citrate synthase